MKIAVIGATGLVGQEILRVLEERQFPLTRLIPVASEASVGKKIRFRNEEIAIVSMQDALALKADIALFSAGGSTSLEWAEKFAETGCRVIDNSSAWRMDPTKKLIVPEVNGDSLTEADLIIANPNCSTIQMVLVLAPLHKKYGIKRVIVSTYQSVTGTGKKAVDQLMNERAGIQGEMAYAHPIDLNLIPQIDLFLDNGYTKEEMKMTNETKKILNDPKVLVSATCVRVPVMGGHSESVNIEFEKEYELSELRSVIEHTAGIQLVDDPQNALYPMPLTHAYKSDLTFVGRIRRDESQEKSVNMWIVSDNLRKGAATNAVQIAEYLVQKQFISR